MEQTFALIKPDATIRNLQGEIIAMIQKNGFKIVAMKMLSLDNALIETLYEAHKEKEFFPYLAEYMLSAPITVLVLEKENAVEDYRVLMGATDPENAEEGTIRKKYALSFRANSVHGSDSVESAKREINIFFQASEIC